jgi:serralysin
VRVAAGDTNGDGFADIITGPGVGGGTLVRVFSGKDGTNLLNFNAYPSAFLGGIFVAAGDVNGDGKADIITGPGIGGGPLAAVFDGPTGNLLRSFNAYPPVTGAIGIVGQSGWVSGLRVAADDVNGDGKADIVTGPGPGQPPEVKVFDAVSLAVLDDFFAYDASYLGGVFVGAGK